MSTRTKMRGLAAAIATLVLPRGEFERENKHFPRLILHTVEVGEDLPAIAKAAGAGEDLSLEQLFDAKLQFIRGRVGQVAGKR